ncbi:formin-like protein 2 isoform X1 [Phoenix dactylifera]|uniref:Formin-like protein n=1 Tax=Phoenix dactylifera TaxID=42345 RepID=A0A8B7CKQ5_PHODC|nr:formin-like protein 2 isoform X1 [Phoenix dactylifera]
MSCFTSLSLFSLFLSESFLIRKMSCASHSLCFLIIFSISTFFFLNSHLLGVAWDLKNKPEDGNAGDKSTNSPGILNDGREENIEEISGEDNVGGEMGFRMLAKFRFLLGLETSSLRRPKHGRHQLSPAPAPSAEAPTPAPITRFHAHVYSRAPLPRKRHTPPVPTLDHGRGSDGAKARLQRIVIAIILSVGATSIILGVTVILVFKRSQRTQKKRSERPSSATSKVSFDPGPELFYLNSLAPYLESDSSFKQTPEFKNIYSNENMSGSPSQAGEQMKCESDAVNCLDEENPPIEASPSDDDSFHSICCSRSSNGSVSDLSEANSGHPTATCSPCNSSYGSTSPNFVLPQFSPTKSPVPTKSHDRTHSTPSSPSANLEGKKFQATPSSSNIEDQRSFFSSLSSQPLVVHSMQQSSLQNHKHSSEPDISSSPSKLAMLSALKGTKKASIPPSSPNNILSSHHTGKTTQSSSVPSETNANGNTPKPPPPPTPPSKPPAVPKIGNSSLPPPPPLPPPKPPSFPKGCNSSLPPQRSSFPVEQTTPVGKDGAPLPKLKPLHWDKVRATSDCSMVWDKIRSSSFELDEQMIESLFGYNVQSCAKNEEAKSKTSSPSKHVMEHKRLQNITILMKAVNATVEQVCDALIQGRGLCVQKLEALVKMTPTKDEQEKISNYDGDIDELGPAEKFVKVVLCIPFAFSRIEVMLYRETFEDEVSHLRKSFAMLEEACKELRSSMLFLRLLEAVLKTGNRMNVGTIRGGARAFKLDALLKLADVKGTDGKTTLLHFVVQEMIRSEGVSAMETATQKTKQEKNKLKTAEEREEVYREMGLELVSGLSTELCNVKKTASIDLDVLISSVSNLSHGMEQLKHLVEVNLSSDDRSGSFVHSMKSFMNHAEKIIQELKSDENRVLLHVREITEYYHGDVSKDEANPLRIFVIVRDFLGMLDRVCRELRSSKTRQGVNPVVPFR